MRKDIQVRRGEHALPQPRNDELPQPLQAELPLAGMIGFRYSSTELYARDGQIHLHIRRSELRNGHLRTEECEGTLDRQAAQHMVMEAQQQFLTQAFGFARLLLGPLLGVTRRD